MTASARPAMTSDGGSTRPSAPWPVIAAFYLWWVLIVVQAIGLAYIGFTFAEAARIGGPAWDIIFVDAPIGVPTLALAVAEIALVFPLRRGNRAARVWLAALAVPVAGSVVLVLAPILQAALIAATSQSFTLTDAAEASRLGLLTIVASAFAIAIVAAILPFIRPVGGFFRTAASAPAPASAPRKG